MSSLAHRPWGTYDILLDTPEVKVKLIEVKPESRMSYQMHSRRQEQWTVIYGELTVVLNDVEFTLSPGQSFNIPLGAKHRAWNKTNKLVRFVEVQTGSYFGEDDIIRYEDDYER
jgi:mannose-6-phosphate isomerase